MIFFLQNHDFLCANINTVFEESTFPEQLKYADVKPVSRHDSIKRTIWF